MRFRNQLLLFSLLISLTGCSSSSGPAPVEELVTNKKSKKKTSSSSIAKGQSTYRVKTGDTLYSIAWYSGNDYQELAKLNNIAAPYGIYPGQEIKLKKPPKPSSKPSQPLTGKTTKTKVNQAVDHSKKQAYGKRKRNVNNPVSKAGITFPKTVKKWIWPAKGKLIGRFSLTETGNKGIDIANKLGSPILAAADGKVVYTGDALRGYGNLIIVKHTDSYLSAYAHNDQILVKEQQWIKAGQKIALMGSSGAQQTMLHFEVRYKGKSIDPLRYLPK